MLSSRIRPGGLLALIGALLSLFAYFALPYVSSFFFTYSAVQLASGPKNGPQTPSNLNPALFWLELVVALAVGALAATYTFKRTLRTLAPAISWLCLSLIMLVVLFAFYIAGLRPPTDLSGPPPVPASAYASGFWLYMLGQIIALLAGLLVLATARWSRRRARAQAGFLPASETEDEYEPRPGRRRGERP